MQNIDFGCLIALKLNTEILQSALCLRLLSGPDESLHFIMAKYDTS